MGKIFFNIYFGVDFVKPFIFTLLEIASFGLFYKDNIKLQGFGLKKWVFFCQIMVFVKMF